MPGLLTSSCFFLCYEIALLSDIDKDKHYAIKKKNMSILTIFL